MLQVSEIGVQPGNGIPHDRYNIRGNAHGRTHRKDNIFMQRQLEQILHVYLEWGKGPYPARAYTTLVVLVVYSASLYPRSLTILLLCKVVRLQSWETFGTMSQLGPFRLF